MGELDFGRRGCSYLKMNSIILILTLVGTVVLATSDRKMDNFAFEKLMDALETEMGQSFRDPPAPGLKYQLLEANSNCKEGLLILNVDTCKKAAASLRLIWSATNERVQPVSGQQNGISTSAYPTGCFLMVSTKRVFYNRNPNGKSTGNGMPVCIQASTKKEEKKNPTAEEVTYEIGPANTNACAAGRLPLTVDECRAAAKQIGAKIKASGARKSTYWSGPGNQRTNSPRGCSYSDEGGFAFNDHHTGGANKWKEIVCKLAPTKKEEKKNPTPTKKEEKKNPTAAAEVTYEIGHENTNACAVGRLPLTVDECRAAAKKLSVKIEKPEESEMSGPGNLRTKAPRGCSYSVEAGFVFNDHHTGGA